jgi:hypothetical protein
MSGTFPSASADHFSNFPPVGAVDLVIDLDLEAPRSQSFPSLLRRRGCDDAAGESGQLRGCARGVVTLWTAKSSPPRSSRRYAGASRRVREQQRPPRQLLEQRLSRRRIRVTICDRGQTAASGDVDRIRAKRVAPSPNFPLHHFFAGPFFLRGLGRPHRLAKGSDLAAPGFCVRRHKRPQTCAQPAPAPTALTDGAHGYPQAITDGCSGCLLQVRRVVHR